MGVFKWEILSSSLFLTARRNTLSFLQLNSISLSVTPVKHVWLKHKKQPEVGTANCIYVRF